MCRGNGQIAVDTQNIVDAIREDLDSRGDDFKWIVGGQVLSKKRILKLFDKDPPFRAMIIKEFSKTALDILKRKK